MHPDRTAIAKLSTILVTILMVTVPMTSLASHNSFGVNVVLAEADEVDQATGDLVPNIPDGHPYKQNYHTNLPLARTGPSDQTGTQYTDCEPTGDIDDSATVGATDQPLEESKLENGTACYIGYMNFQWEYVFAGAIYALSTHNLFGVHLGYNNPIPAGAEEDDQLYPYNPAPGDERCNAQGSDNHDHTVTNVSTPAGQVGADEFGQEEVDQPLARANQTWHGADDNIDGHGPGGDHGSSSNLGPPTPVDAAEGEGPCTGEGHSSFYPGFQSILEIDTRILEDPLHDNLADKSVGPAGGNTISGTDPGASYLTIPVLTSYYLHLFGEPHPKNDDPSPCKAGEGPFGADPVPNGAPGCEASGSPVTAVPQEVCKTRTDTCTLLTPTDVRLYDTDARHNSSFPDVARVCSFEPQFVTVNPSARAGGPCGVFGDRFNEFRDSTSQGGLGSDSVPDTYRETLPGWYMGVLFVNVEPWFTVVDVSDEWAGNDGAIPESYWLYAAVNPRIPDATHQVWCTRPNYLSSAGSVDVTPARNTTNTSSGLAWLANGEFDADGDSDGVPDSWTPFGDAEVANVSLVQDPNNTDTDNAVKLEANTTSAGGIAQAFDVEAENGTHLASVLARTDGGDNATPTLQVVDTTSGDVVAAVEGSNGSVTPEWLNVSFSAQEDTSYELRLGLAGEDPDVAYFDEASVADTSTKLATRSGNQWFDGLFVDDAVTLPDPGFYGDFVADAKDTDVYVTAGHQPYRDVLDLDVAGSDVHSTTSGAVNDTLALTSGAATVPGVGQFIPEEVNRTLNETFQRTDFTESNDNETHAQPGAQNQHPFTKTFKAGLGCDGFGVIQLRPEAVNVDGGLRFNAEMSQQTVSIKDPTLLSNFTGTGVATPAQENNTTEGAWMADSYSFQGVTEAVVDTNKNGLFDDCAVANGQPQPNADFCANWGLWDVYNDQCTDAEGNACADIMAGNATLNGSGYDVHGEDSADTASGVGLFFVLRVTGPVLIGDEVIGDDDTTAQNCIIGISKGFADHLAGHIAPDDTSKEYSSFYDNSSDLGNETTGELGFSADDREALCPNTEVYNAAGDNPDTENGEIFVIRDAFRDQAGGDPGGFSSSVSWTKLLPTPKGADAAGMIQDDVLEVHGIWSVNGTTPDGDNIADDTSTNLRLSGVNHFVDVDPLTSDFGQSESQ